MPYFQDIASIRTKLTRVCMNNTLGGIIHRDILSPILDQLESDGKEIIEDAAMWLKNRIQSYMAASVPTGRTYKIVSYDPAKPRGQRSNVIGEYTASAPGEPPASLTGTLVDSVGYEIDYEGRIRIGLMPEYGEMSDAGSELVASGYAWGSIIINEENAKATPVGTYGRALEEGYSSYVAGPIAARPWFQPVMDEYRDEFRKRIRDSIRESLNRATSSSRIRRGIIFKVYIRGG